MARRDAERLTAEGVTDPAPRPPASSPCQAPPGFWDGDGGALRIPHGHLVPSLLTRNGGTVSKLAQTIYDERKLPSGYLDRARRAVLADAMEEAGCVDVDVLHHLRQSGGVHVRGCWVVDLLPGKA